MLQAAAFALVSPRDAEGCGKPGNGTDYIIHPIALAGRRSKVTPTY